MDDDRIYSISDDFYQNFLKKICYRFRLTDSASIMPAVNTLIRRVRETAQVVSTPAPPTAPASAMSAGTAGPGGTGTPGTGTPGTAVTPETTINKLKDVFMKQLEKIPRKYIAGYRTVKNILQL